MSDTNHNQSQPETSMPGRSELQRLRSVSAPRLRSRKVPISGAQLALIQECCGLIPVGGWIRAALLRVVAGEQIPMVEIPEKLLRGPLVFTYTVNLSEAEDQAVIRCLDKALNFAPWARDIAIRTALSGGVPGTGGYEAAKSPPSQADHSEPPVDTTDVEQLEPPDSVC